MDFVFSSLRIIGIIFMVLMVFNLMILVHEWGHFLAGRWRGLKIEKFQIWFGKPIWKKEVNGVQYGLGWIPAGGFVALPQMVTMEAIEGESENKDPLPPITPLDKIIVAFAGPLFSFLLACFFAVVVWVAGKPESESNVTREIGYVLKDSPADKGGLKPGDEIITIDGKPVRSFRAPVDSVIWNIVSSEGDTIDFLVNRPGAGEMTLHVKAEKPATDPNAAWWKSLFTRPPFRKVGINGRETAMVAEVEPNGPAAEAGIKANDLILSVDGVPMRGGVLQLFEYVEAHQDKKLSLEIERAEKRFTVAVTPRLPDIRPKDWVKKDLGISKWDMQGKRKLVYPSPIAQITDAARQMAQTLGAIASPKSDVKAAHLSSFIGIVRVYYNLFEDPYGWQLVLWFSVVLNINLAILNMLPFPVLDGGHIVMATVESIRRRPLNLRVLEVVQSAAVLLLLGLMAFLMLKDTGDLLGVSNKAPTDAKKEEKAEGPIEIKFLPAAERAAAVK